MRGVPIHTQGGGLTLCIMILMDKFTISWPRSSARPYVTKKLSLAYIARGTHVACFTCNERPPDVTSGVQKSSEIYSVILSPAGVYE